MTKDEALIKIKELDDKLSVLENLLDYYKNPEKYDTTMDTQLAETNKSIDLFFTTFIGKKQ